MKIHFLSNRCANYHLYRAHQRTRGLMNSERNSRKRRDPHFFPEYAYVTGSNSTKNADLASATDQVGPVAVQAWDDRLYGEDGDSGIFKIIAPIERRYVVSAWNKRGFKGCIFEFFMASVMVLCDVTSV